MSNLFVERVYMQICISSAAYIQNVRVWSILHILQEV